jgi:sulfite reductase (NADPH) hemoprotein beta-component
VATQGGSDVERVKAESRFLRGTIVESLEDPLTGAVRPDDAQLLKFHGTYQQDDRDLREERRRSKLEPAYQFMVRVRAPGGVVTPAQWLVLDELARTYGDGSLRLTTRQSFQIHGVLKRDLRATIAGVHQTLLTTLAACGDVNRNVMCHPNPHRSRLHGQAYRWAAALSEHLAPRTRAYHEIWVDGAKVADSRGDDEEPLYGPTYLPRKFKIGIAVPPSNDVDVFSQDLGLIAIAAGQELVGFNVAVGGGMGMTYGDPATYPNLAEVIGFCPAERLLAVATAVIAVQRDFGDRSDRKHARLKYTIADRGLAWFRAELERRLGFRLEEPRPYRFDGSGDTYGWVEGSDGRHHLTLFVENGRLREPQLAGLRAIARGHGGDFRLTPNQNLIVAGVAAADRDRVAELARAHGLSAGEGQTPLRRSSLACVALPTCGLAMAEAERYLPRLLDRLEAILAELGLGEEPIGVRMSGCPNGCARPYLGEIGLTGKAPGRYNLYLGASCRGDRLNRLYRENLDEEGILAALRPILADFARARLPGERFGDFVVRAGYVRAVTSGPDFHAP